MNYHDLKTLHICSVILFLICSTLSLYFPTKKMHKALSGIAGIIALASGFLMLRRFGISHSGPFPTWVIIKIGLWLSLMLVIPIIVKKVPQSGRFLLPLIIAIGFVATAMAIYKPL